MPKPVCFFDLETTGTHVQKDRIVEIAIVKLTGEEETEFYSLVNPEMAIPKRGKQCSWHYRRTSSCLTEAN